jgi:hypothetical protein
MGNPGGNSLYRRKLLHLREVATALTNKANVDQDSEK